jgi:hypothetical protein
LEAYGILNCNELLDELDLDRASASSNCYPRPTLTGELSLSEFCGIYIGVKLEELS